MNVVNASKKLENFSSGLSCLHLSDSEALVDLGDDVWEIRYVSYLDTKSVFTVPFGDFVDLEKLQLLEGSYREIYPGLTVYAFNQPDHIKEKGIYFTVSLRKICSKMV